MAASDVAFLQTNFFRIAGTTEAEISVSGKGDCLLAIGKDTKSKLFGVTYMYSFAVKLKKKPVGLTR